MVEFVDFRTQSTGDAERNAIGVIPEVLKDLTQERAIAVLDYILERYRSGDDFGLK